MDDGAFPSYNSCPLYIYKDRSYKKEKHHHIYIIYTVYIKHWDISLYMQYKPFLLEYGWGKSKVSVNVDKLVFINQKAKKKENSWLVSP